MSVPASSCRGQDPLSYGRQVSDFELVRITHASDADPCDLLSREYMGWLVEQLRLRYDIAVDDAQVEEIHRDMQSDGPSCSATTVAYIWGRSKAIPSRSAS